MAIDTQTETKIVAMIARGDTYADIQSQLLNDGIKLSIPGISKIKARNEQALSFIQNKMMEVEASKSAQILSKARNLIDKKLDKMDDTTDLDDLEDHKDEMEFPDYMKLKESIKSRNNITVKDLTTVSKEFFNQSQIEAGRPTSITESPEQAKKNLKVLLEAINSGNEEAMAKAIFLDA